MTYQVLIVDDEEIVCRGLAQFVKWGKYDFLVAATACSADDALALMKTMHVDVVFMDIRMPGKSGLELLKMISQESVSYTHLDVYKRQVLHLCVILELHTGIIQNHRQAVGRIRQDFWGNLIYFCIVLHGT